MGFGKQWRHSSGGQGESLTHTYEKGGAKEKRKNIVRCETKMLSPGVCLGGFGGSVAKMG